VESGKRLPLAEQNFASLWPCGVLLEEDLAGLSRFKTWQSQDAKAPACILSSDRGLEEMSNRNDGPIPTAGVAGGVDKRLEKCLG